MAPAAPPRPSLRLAPWLTFVQQQQPRHRWHPQGQSTLLLFAAGAFDGYLTFVSCSPVDVLGYFALKASEA